MADKSTGWVKLYRSISQWEWFTEPRMVQMYVYLIASANSQPNRWNGVDILPGQMVTSYRHLAAATGMSSETAHRIIKRLEKTGELNAKPNARFTIITLNNYTDFQSSQTLTKRSPNGDQTQAKPNKKDKEYKKDKEIGSPPANLPDGENSTGWKAKRKF